MNIGFFSEALPYLPCREGFRIYAANILGALARRHRVHLVTFVNPDETSSLGWVRRHCASVATIPLARHSLPARTLSLVWAYSRGTPLHYVEAAQTLLERGRQRDAWDVLHVEGAFAGGLVPRSFGLPRILSLHDSEAFRWRDLARCAEKANERFQAWVMAQHAARYERLVCPRFDRCVVVTDSERVRLRSVAPAARIEVIGNGTDTEYFRPEGQRAGRRPVLAFHGNLEYTPNVLAAVELVEEILPRVARVVPDVKVLLVGARPGARVRRLGRQDNVEVRADVPDVPDALEATWLYVCPVRHGGGIKNKILEAMAMRLPVVAYPEAVDGIDAIDGVHLAVADGPERCAAEVIRLLDDPARADALGRGARGLMERCYSWDSRAAAYESLYRALGEGQPAGSVPGTCPERAEPAS